MHKFLESGKFILGLNYWASHAATEMWSKWDLNVIEHDFNLMHQYGIQVVRCFPLWSDFQPIKLMRQAGPPGGIPIEIRMGELPLPDTFAGQCGVDEIMLEHFRELCDIALKNNIKLIVPLLTGHMTARQFVPPALEGMDVFTAPLALKYEVKFIQCFVSTFKDHPAVAAWESGNESNYMSAAAEPAAAWVWTALIHGAIRNCDPDRPIIGVSDLAIDETPTNKWLIRDQAELSDILAGHPYALWNPVYGREEFHAIRNLHHAAFEVRLLSDISCKPAFIEETGTWRPMVGSLQNVADAIRNILWNLYQENGRGLLWWCAFDQNHIDVAPYDWGTMGLEHGIFDTNGKAHPAAESMLAFRRFIDSLPFENLPERKHDAVCIVNDHEVAFSTYLLARQAGIHLRFRHPSQPLNDSNVYFLPSAKKRGGFSTKGWHRLLKKVHDGAVLYLSLNDTILDMLEEASGCCVLERKITDDTGNYDLCGIPLSLPRRVRYRMEATKAEILGHEDNGNPVFFKMEYGKGVIYTLAFPLEREAIDHTDTFNDNGWQIYRRILNPECIIRNDNPFLQCSEHFFSSDKAIIILVNNQPEELIENIAIDEAWTITGSFTDHSSCYLDGTNLKMPKNSGILLTVQKKELNQ